MMAPLGGMSLGVSVFCHNFIGSSFGYCSFWWTCYIFISWIVFGVTDINVMDNYWSADVFIASKSMNSSAGTRLSIFWLSSLVVFVYTVTEENLGIGSFPGIFLQWNSFLLVRYQVCFGSRPWIFIHFSNVHKIKLIHLRYTKDLLCSVLSLINILKHK